jgi:hypothetical protein
MAGGVQPEATYIYTHICRSAAAIAKKTLQIKLGLAAAVLPAGALGVTQMLK